jgi:GrpB-like predicted nucleotidyltransferase (UPF0157 family)
VCAGFELIGGTEKRDIRVVAYDPDWRRRFGEHRGRIAAVLGAAAVRVDHVGSTAVPGLVAKPIIDIELSVPEVEDENAYLPPLASAGYLLRVREPGHRMVRTADRGVHAHVCSAGSDWERRHLLFRDWLRHSAGDREAYGQLKCQLARREWADMNEYAAAKAPLIDQITHRAQAWACSAGWAPNLQPTG